jgi:hypothetical protein
MTSVPVPDGDPRRLQALADQLEVLGIESWHLGTDTRQAAASIRSSADWTGVGADAFTGFAENLSQGASAAQGPLQRMAAAVRWYADCLSTAQQKAGAANAMSDALEEAGTGPLISQTDITRQAAQSALDALARAGKDAAGQVTSAAAELEDLYKKGRVQLWIDKQAALGQGNLLVSADPGHDGQPVPAGGVNNWTRPPVPGDTAYQVRDPNDRGITITDFDSVLSNELVEKKAFTGFDTLGQNADWVQSEIIAKLDKYYEARQYAPGYENASLRVEFERGANQQLRQAAEKATASWEETHPGAPVVIYYSGAIHER